jgi:hypothetical protein
MSPEERLAAAGYVRALWFPGEQRYWPPGPPPRTMTLQEALEEITAETEDDG